jgi:hypothetical protein
MPPLRSAGSTPARDDTANRRSSGDAFDDSLRRDSPASPGGGGTRPPIKPLPTIPSGDGNNSTGSSPAPAHGGRPPLSKSSTLSRGSVAGGSSGVMHKDASTKVGAGRRSVPCC